MDDITIYTKIAYWYYYKDDRRDAHQKMIDKMHGKNNNNQMIPAQIQKDTTVIFQESIDMVQEYLIIVNVPINNNKTQLIIIQRKLAGGGEKKDDDTTNEDAHLSNDIIAESEYRLLPGLFFSHSIQDNPNVCGNDLVNVETVPCNLV